MTRTPCIVPSCRRTTKQTVEPPDDCWICGNHWRPIPVQMKAVKRRARAALRRRPDDPAALARYLRLARRVTRLAVERAFGI